MLCACSCPHTAWRSRLWPGPPEVPQVRVRNMSWRQAQQLAELTVLNERLASGSGGSGAIAARKRIEWLRARRRVWERIYSYVTKQDAAATLAVIEDANSKAGAPDRPAGTPRSRARGGAGARWARAASGGGAERGGARAHGRRRAQAPPGAAAGGGGRRARAPARHPGAPRPAASLRHMHSSR